MNKSIILELKVWEEDVLSRIPNSEDVQLVREAILALKAGALRAAYIMIWIACAESLKRRLKVAAERDSAAGKLLGDIEDAENKHHAVDKLLMDCAVKLELISDVEKTRLEQVFVNRNLYGHPYNLAPRAEDVISALQIGVDAVLSKRDRFGHFYIKERLNFLLTDASFLPDEDSRIADYAKAVANRVDERLHNYLFMSYVEGIEKIVDDPERYVLRRRGLVFCKAYLDYVGVAAVVPVSKWHDLLALHPVVMSWIAGFDFVFALLDDNAKNISVVKNIEYCDDDLERLGRMFRLGKKGLLTQSQMESVDAKFQSLKCYNLKGTGLSLDDLFEYAIRRLNSFMFDMANPAAYFFFYANREELATLSEEKQLRLGHSLAQASLWNAFDAVSVVSKIADNELKVPQAVQIGYCKGFFSPRVVEALKRKQLCVNSVKILFGLPSDFHEAIVAEFRDAVDNDVDVHNALSSAEATDFNEAFRREQETAKFAF